MEQKKWAMAACLAAAFVSAPAFATSSASASLTNFTVTLYSLNPSSSGVPTITFDTPLNAASQAIAYDFSAGNYLVDSGSGFGSQSVSTAISSAASSITAGAGLPSQYIQGSASGPFGSPTGFSVFQAVTNASFSSFTLSANTLAVFTFTGTATAKTTVGYDDKSGQSEYSYASGYARVIGSNGYNGYQDLSDQFYLHASHTSTWDPTSGTYVHAAQDLTQNFTLQTSFVNTTGASLSGQLYSHAEVYGNSSIAAVPEPETYAMLLAGLGLLGMRAKRRGAKHA